MNPLIFLPSSFIYIFFLGGTLSYHTILSCYIVFFGYFSATSFKCIINGSEVYSFYCECSSFTVCTDLELHIMQKPLCNIVQEKKVLLTII